MRNSHSNIYITKIAATTPRATEPTPTPSLDGRGAEAVVGGTTSEVGNVGDGGDSKEVFGAASVLELEGEVLEAGVGSGALFPWEGGGVFVGAAGAGAGVAEVGGLAPSLSGDAAGLDDDCDCVPEEAAFVKATNSAAIRTATTDRAIAIRV